MRDQAEIGLTPALYAGWIASEARAVACQAVADARTPDAMTRAVDAYAASREAWLREHGWNEEAEHEHRPVGTIDTRTGPHTARCSCGIRIRATQPGSVCGDWVPYDPYERYAPPSAIDD